MAWILPSVKIDCKKIKKRSIPLLWPAMVVNLAFCVCMKSVTKLWSWVNNTHPLHQTQGIWVLGRFGLSIKSWVVDLSHSSPQFCIGTLLRLRPGEGDASFHVYPRRAAASGSFRASFWGPKVDYFCNGRDMPLPILRVGSPSYTRA